MARTRSIKPDWTKDPDLARCSPRARLLFIALWGLADRRGVLPDRPRELKAHVFPNELEFHEENVDVEELLGELARERVDSPGALVERFETPDGRRWLWVRNLTRHQTFHHAEHPRREWPSPPPELAGREVRRPAAPTRRVCDTADESTPSGNTQGPPGAGPGHAPDPPEACPAVIRNRGSGNGSPPPEPPPPDGGGGQPGAAQEPRNARLRRELEQLEELGADLGARTDRAWRRRMRARLRGGERYEDLAAELEREAEGAKPRPARPDPDPRAWGIWQNVAGLLKHRLPTKAWDTWIRPTEGHRLEEDGQVLVVTVPGEQHADRLVGEYFAAQINGALEASASGTIPRRVVYEVDPP